MTLKGLEYTALTRTSSNIKNKWNATIYPPTFCQCGDCSPSSSLYMKFPDRRSLCANTIGAPRVSLISCRNRHGHRMCEVQTNIFTSNTRALYAYNGSFKRMYRWSEMELTPKWLKALQACPFKEPIFLRLRLSTTAWHHWISWLECAGLVCNFPLSKKGWHKVTFGSHTHANNAGHSHSICSTVATVINHKQAIMVSDDL